MRRNSKMPFLLAFFVSLLTMEIYVSFHAVELVKKLLEKELNENKDDDDEEECGNAGECTNNDRDDDDQMDQTNKADS